MNYDEEGGNQHIITINVIDGALRSILVCVVVNVNPKNEGTPGFVATDPTVFLAESSPSGACFYQVNVIIPRSLSLDKTPVN